MLVVQALGLPAPEQPPQSKSPTITGRRTALVTPS
jgi:hypothetical protein